MAERRRIVILSTSLELGGAETQVARLAIGLQDRGWGVEVIALVPVHHYRSVLHSHGIAVHSLEASPGRADPRLLTRLWVLLRRSRPQVLLTFLFHANVLGRIAGRAAGVPVVISSIRNSHFGGRLGRPLMRITDRLADRTVANSSMTAKLFVESGVVDRRKMRVIGNGLNFEQYASFLRSRKELRAAAGLAGDEFVWLCVGRLQRQKNHAGLLRAFRTLVDRPGLPRTPLLWLAGAGELRGDLEGQARDLGILSSVRFLGQRNDIPELLAISDGFVLASHHEGLPNAVLEAMACSRPVVATAVGGVPELVEDGSTGWLVEPGDEVALADALVEATSATEGELERLGAAGRALAAARYDLRAVIDRWEELLVATLDDRRGTRR